MNTPAYKQFEEMLAETRHESDRACALVLAANLDNRLRVLLSSFFIKITSDYEKQIFEGNGCLANFSSRIKMSYASGLLANSEHHDLNIIRKIRNYFAHKEHGWSFQTQDVKDRCLSFAMIAQIRQEYPELTIDLTNPRTVFQITASSLSLLLLSRAETTKKTRRSISYPSSILPSRGIASDETVDR